MAAGGYWDEPQTDDESEDETMVDVNLAKLDKAISASENAPRRQSLFDVVQEIERTHKELAEHIARVKKMIDLISDGLK